MQGYYGKFRHTMTDNGRVSLPAKFRRDLPESLVAIPSPRREFRALYLFVEADFHAWMDEIFDKMGGYDAGNIEHTDLRSYYTENAEQVDVDKSGRISISDELRTYASLAGEILVTGDRDHICLWNLDNYAAYQRHRETLSLLSNKAKS